MQRSCIKDKSGKVINIGTKDAADLMKWVSKDEIAHDEVKTTFNDEIIKILLLLKN